MERPAFHLAFGVHDLDAARSFYVELLGCGVGRSDARWIDFEFHGHQIVAHLVERNGDPPPSNLVDGDSVPVPHFGVVLDWSVWQALAERLAAAGAAFLIQPRVRFVGQVGEQATMFLADPSGNVLEFKAMRRPELLFASPPPS